jgi:hypothetical protein
MTAYTGTPSEPVGGTWEQAAHRVRQLAGQQGVVLDEEELHLLDVREVLDLHRRLQRGMRRNDPRRLQALTRLAGLGCRG